MEAYKRWVRRNKDYVSSLESLANGLTWLLPERFAESEIGPEAVTSILGIVTAVNEHIIETTPTELHTRREESSSFPFSLCITLLKDLETLIEVVAQQYYGDEKKWNFIAVMEACKVFVRLALLKNSGYKMLLHGGESANVENVSAASNTHQRDYPLGKPLWHQDQGSSKKYVGQNQWNLEGRALSALNRFGENARMVSEPTWLRRVQHQQAIMEPPTVVVEKPSLSTFLSEKGIPGGLLVLGEVLFILRPLIYVLLIRKYGTRSWFPWFISLAVDLTGNSVLSCLTMKQHRGKGGQFHLSLSEKDEIRRRRLLWALYLMRDPFFTLYTRHRLESTQKILEPVPVIGFFTEKLIELLMGAQTRYTYMSGS